MKIYIASDHAGFELKNVLKEFLSGKNTEVIDMGNRSFDGSDDYPDFIIPLAEKVAEEKESLGIIIGRSGNGEAIAANKVKGIRAALGISPEMAKLAREHNHANILSLGAGFISFEEAIKTVEVFIETPFSEEERHVRRLSTITAFEEKKA